MIHMLLPVAPQRLAKLQRAVLNRMSGFRIVIDGVQDPGNHAAVMRTAEALGLLDLHVIRYVRDKPQRRTSLSKSITKGGEQWLRIHFHNTAGDCLHHLRQEGFSQILAAKPRNPQTDTARNPVELSEVDFGKKTALIIGNEKNGVSSEMSELCDGDFCIDMHGL
ncbi:hypothetical protein GUITHDRAFT_151995, partial [Guillardia theta CCMP2712]